MFEIHVLVAGIVMFNILELIIEIVHNYPIRQYTRKNRKKDADSKKHFSRRSKTVSAMERKQQCEMNSEKTKKRCR
jgi:hypothetical protein